jgi:hypothetical protein
MAGITATSVTTSLVAGDTSTDKNVSGFIVGEKITLGLTSAGTTRKWSLGVPNGSAVAKSALSDTTGTAPYFTPDVAGYYVLTCIIDSVTTYILRIACAAEASVDQSGPSRFAPLADSEVPTPVAGVTLYYSSTQSALCIKTSAGAVRTVNTTAV